MSGESALASIKAKSARGTERPEMLTAHTALVVERLASLHSVHPGLAARVGEPRLWSWAFWACVLHDLGKAAGGFQKQLEPGAAIWGHRHEVLSLAFLGCVHPKPSEQEEAWIAAAVASHHKDYGEIRKLYSEPESAEDDILPALLGEIEPAVADGLGDWLAANPRRWMERWPVFGDRNSSDRPAAPQRDLREKGAGRIYELLRQYGRLVKALKREPATSPSNLAAIALRGLVLMADHTASAHESFRATLLGDPRAFVVRLGLEWQALHAHQQAVAEPTGHTLLSAPTGSGKTEAALLWAARQQATDPTRSRFFYVLPYQASLNAMRDRLGSAVGEDAVTLQHSRAMQALYRRLLDKSYAPGAASAIAKREVALARLHCRSVRILTPYQLLRGAFRLRGYEALITDAEGGVFIWDELHAYEPRRLGMILGLMEYLASSWGGRSLVMSATLPSALRELLGQVLGEMAEINADAATYRAFARHVVHVEPGCLQEHYPRVVKDVEEGRSVLVVCNTVAGAIEAWTLLSRKLQAMGTEVQLLHGRFNSEDRFRKERQVAEVLGTRTRRLEGPPAALVATQVVEVSLDLDFDALWSEPAPLEALVQRFGRVNRARRRPGAPVHVFSQPVDGQRIYDRRYVTAALRCLQGLNGRLLDEQQVTLWIDEVYASDLGHEWRQAVSLAKGEFTAACTADLRAFESDPGLTDAFDNMFDGTEVLPRCLLRRYEELSEEAPLEAASLLVPISSAQLARLFRAGRVARATREDPYIVEAPYDSQKGLVL